MKTFVEGVKDSLEETENILKDINIDLVQSKAMKEQGFYDLMIELRIFEEADIYPSGREGKLYPKTVTETELRKLYENLLEKQLEKNREMLDTLVEIINSKEALLGDLKAKININFNNGSTTTSEAEDDDSETYEAAIKMKIIEAVDSGYY